MFLQTSERSIESEKSWIIFFVSRRSFRLGIMFSSKNFSAKDDDGEEEEKVRRIWKKLVKTYQSMLTSRRPRWNTF